MRMFDSVRNRKHEVQASYVIHQRLYQPGVYNYEKEKDTQFNNSDFKQMIIDEIKQVKQSHSSMFSPAKR